MMYVPQIKSQAMRHALMNLDNTTLFKKYVGGFHLVDLIITELKNHKIC